MSNLSLGLLVERLPDSVVPQPDPPDLVGFNAQTTLRKNINRLLERFHTEGKWEGTVTQTLITAYEDDNGNKFITLPRHLETCIRGSKPGRKTRSTQSEWYQYLPNGRGIRQATDQYFGPLQDLGQGFVTYRDIETPGQLTVSSDATEVASTFIWIRGKDANGDKIYSSIGGTVAEGIRLDLATSPQTTSQTFSEIYSVEKKQTIGNVTISVGGTEIAKYEPGERKISYRRYLCDRSWDEVKGIFKRKYQWAISDNDPVYPDNLEAIKLGLMALNAEDKQDVERSQYYMDRAIQLLNAELKEYNSGQEGTMQPATWLTKGFINMR